MLLVTEETFYAVWKQLTAIEMCLKLFKRYSKCIGTIFPFPNCCSLIIHLHILTLGLCVFSKKFEGFHWWEKKTCWKPNLCTQQSPNNFEETLGCKDLAENTFPFFKRRCEIYCSITSSIVLRVACLMCYTPKKWN